MLTIGKSGFPVVIFAFPVTIFNANAPCELLVVPPNARACVTLPVTFGPNVKGDITAQSTGGAIIAVQADDPQHGALYCSNYGYENITHYSGLAQANTLNLNASRSNSIYTDNGRIFPRSILLNYILKV